MSGERGDLCTYSKNRSCFLVIIVIRIKHVPTLWYRRQVDLGWHCVQEDSTSHDVNVGLLESHSEGLKL